MKKVFSLGQTILAIAFLGVAIRHQFFGWQSTIYVIASGGLIAGMCAWIEFAKQNISRKAIE